jgi:hypothetical protein
MCAALRVARDPFEALMRSRRGAAMANSYSQAIGDAEASVGVCLGVGPHVSDDQCSVLISGRKILPAEPDLATMALDVRPTVCRR